MSKALFITLDGMTDPLGQSQVLPYLVGLSATHEIHLISMEKEERFARHESTIRKITSDAGITWHPIPYQNKIPIVSGYLNNQKMQKLAFDVIKKEGIDIIHCRSYFPVPIGLKAKKKFNCKLVFDMRGFWADERVESGLWKMKNPIYQRIFKHFKKIETNGLNEADWVVALTHNAKNVIDNWSHVKTKKEVQVIPCCTDFDHFNRDSISNDIQEQFMAKHGLSRTDDIAVYLGSVGTWYLLDDMLKLYRAILKRKPHYKFLFLTKEAPSIITEKATEMGISLDNIIIDSAERSELPSLLALCRFSIFFYLPAFSKKGTSPTKMGELMAMGLPLICNTNIGDVDHVMGLADIGHVIKNMDANGIEEAADQVDRLATLDRNVIRETSAGFYNLQDGLATWKKIYNT